MQSLCVKCQAHFLPKRTGVTVIETAGTPPKPVRLWSADLLACPICHAELITHFSHEPMLEKEEAGFEALLAEVKPENRYILHNPEYLAQTVRHETTYVRSREKQNRLRTTDR